MEEYDVFLSHNGKDKPIVKTIAAALEQYHLKVWLDVAVIQPGTPFLPGIESGLQQSNAVAVFIGPNSMGQWEVPEVRIAIAEYVRRKISVIPVFLPGTTDNDINQLPPFLATYRWIDFRKGADDLEALDNLRWGITGEKPKPRVSPATSVEPREKPAQLSLVDETVANLVQLLKSQNVTYFLGAGASYSNPPARACDVARELLSDLGIIPKDYQQLLPPIDIAGMYYSLNFSDRRLEDKVVEMMTSFPQEIPPTQQRLATLLQLLTKRKPGRMRVRTPQLIVTTNLDVMIERALLRAGLGFTRIVQHRSADQIDINEYRDAQLVEENTLQLPAQSEREPPIRISLDDPDMLDELIRTYGSRSHRADENTGTGENPLHKLPLQEMTEPILYKFLGSQDIPNSCVLSTTHHFAFASSVLKRNCIPAIITEIIGNSTILFIGLPFMDPYFRLTDYTLLQSALKMRDYERYAVQLPPDFYRGDIYREMETNLWEKIKDFGMLRHGIKTIEEQNDVFLEKVINGVQADLGSGR